MFEWREVRARFRRAPLAFWLALLVTLLFAIPLYLLKIELTPRELAWLPSLLFVAFIFPARILTGWATSRALRRETDRHWTARWLGRLAILPGGAGLCADRVHHAVSLVEWRAQSARTARLPRPRAADGALTQ